MTPPRPEFNFTALDGLTFASVRKRLNGAPIPIMTAARIGPLLELVRLSAAGYLPTPSRASFLLLGKFAPMLQALEANDSHWICQRTRMSGFLRLTAPLQLGEAALTGFGLAAQKAAISAGFPRQTAAQMAAALGELHSNIHEHSQAANTGVLAFHAIGGRFEFAAYDDGIGILESLRSSVEYQTLSDHGEALGLALSDGVSRFGSNTGRGLGFRPIFIGLANLQGALRFRSGDHALIIDGQSPSLMTATKAQKPPLKGFIVSISCAPNDLI